MSRYFQVIRERRGAWLLARHGALNAARQAVRGGATIAMGADQRARMSPVVVPFFGRPALTEQSPVLLMRRQKVPLLVGACLCTKQADRFRMIIPTVLWPEECRDQSIEQLVERVNRAMEKLILSAPDHYMWIHDRYRGSADA